MFDKATWYDWNGANVDIFKAINGLSGQLDIYDTFMQLLSQIADRHNFPYYILGLLIYVMTSYLVAKIRGDVRKAGYLGVWLGVFLVLVGGYAADGLLVHEMKDYFSYPRPYIALSGDHIQVLERHDSDDSMHSFPSGHASFATIMVIGLFPVLSVGLRFVGVFFIFGVCWSRMALGMHFPVDVIAGFSISLVVMLIVQRFVALVLNKLFGIRC